MHLTDKEAQLLEMELVYEQVTRLSQRYQMKAENGKEDTLHLAKEVSLQTDLLLTHCIATWLVLLQDSEFTLDLKW